MKRMLVAGATLAAATALGGDAYPTAVPDASTTFDVPAGDTYDRPLTPADAQQALAHGISCDIRGITSLFHYGPMGDNYLSHPHTELDLDVSLHYTPEAAAAYKQYEYDDGVRWDGGSAVEIFKKENPDDPHSRLQDIGSSVISVSGHIQRPDMYTLVPTEAITAPGNVLMPYRSVYLKTSKEVLLAKIPCAQVFDVAKDGVLQKRDLHMPVHITAHKANEREEWEEHTYSGKNYPLS